MFLVCALSLVGCTSGGGASPPDAVTATDAKSGRGGRCDDTLPTAPVLAPLSSAQYPLSKLRLAADIPVQSVVARLNQEVPSVLARVTDRPVGAPGRATYLVKRGTFQLKWLDDRLGLSVPVSADISVCKPLGGLCLRYGQCTPAFDVHFSMNTLLGAEYDLSPPRGSLRVTRKCVIGLDVTDQLEALAQGELAKVQRQIAQRWPDIPEEAQRAWSALAQPLRVTPVDCVVFDGTSVHYSPPHLTHEGDRISLELGIEGRLQNANSCSDEHVASALPKPKQRKRVVRQSELWVPELIATDVFRDSVKQRLDGSWSQKVNDVLTVAEIRFGADRVALLLNLKGRICQPVWIEAGLRSVPDGSIHLYQARIITAPGGASLDGLSEELLRHLEQSPLYAPRGAAWTSKERVAGLLDQLHALMPEGVLLDLSVQDPKPSRVQINQDGILLAHSVRARLAVKDL